MKIKLLPDNKVYSGTPTSIVSKLRRDAIFMKTKNAEEYIEKVTRRLSAELGEVVKISGKNLEERCGSFVAGMLSRRQAAVFVDKQSLDRHSIIVLRKALGLSQEDLAREIGVSFVTVCRWECGHHQPRTGAVLENLGRVAAEFLRRA